MVSRTGATGAGRGDVAADVARHADDLLRRRARHGRRAHPAELLRLRREHPALVGGAISGVTAEGDVLRYVRGEGAGRLAVALNLGARDQEIALGKGRVLLTPS